MALDLRQAYLGNAENWFTYHPPVGDQAQRYIAIRKACLECARKIVEAGEPSWELSEAMKELRAVMMWANASIACNPDDKHQLEARLRTEAMQREQDKATIEPGAPA
jgi:hypothetical protein